MSVTFSFQITLFYYAPQTELLDHAENGKYFSIRNELKIKKSFASGMKIFFLLTGNFKWL